MTTEVRQGWAHRNPRTTGNTAQPWGRDKQTEGGGAGNRTRVRKPVTGTSTCVARVLFSPGCAHERARTERAILCFALCPDRDYRELARSVTPAGELWLAHPLDGSLLVFRQREQVRYRWHLLVSSRDLRGRLDPRHAAQIS
jgi:hypothetical protein